jgi:hypothetical protein
MTPSLLDFVHLGPFRSLPKIREKMQIFSKLEFIHLIYIFVLYSLKKNHAYHTPSVCLPEFIPKSAADKGDADSRN